MRVVLISQVPQAVQGLAPFLSAAGHEPVALLCSREHAGLEAILADMRAQIEQVGENIKAALEAAGATLADIVKTTTYVTDMDEYFKHQDMRMRYFADPLPTSTFPVPHVNAGSVTVSRTALTSSGYDGSRVGFRGTEDLAEASPPASGSNRS